MTLIPGPRPAADDLIDDAELHAEVARRFAAAAKFASEQPRFLLTVQTVRSSQNAAFEAAVAARIEQHADDERKAALVAKEAVR